MKLLDIHEILFFSSFFFCCKQLLKFAGNKFQMKDLKTSNHQIVTIINVDSLTFTTMRFFLSSSSKTGNQNENQNENQNGNKNKIKINVNKTSKILYFRINKTKQN